MKNKACCWILIVIGALFVLFVVSTGIAVSVMVARSGETTTVIADSTYLVLDLSGPLVEYNIQPSFDFLGMSKQITVADMWRSLEHAAKDRKIAGVIVKPLGIGGFAEIRETRTALQNFRKSGKPVYAYLDLATDRDYYLASVADSIIMNPAKSGGMTLLGLNIQQTYLAKTFEKVGIRFHTLHVGQYKGAFENYSKDKMSEPLRESLQSMLDSIYSTYTQEIVASRRGLTLDKLNAEILNGKKMFLWGSDAVAMGLVDKTMDWQDFKEGLKSGKDLRTVTPAKYVKTFTPKAKLASNEVAVLFAEGQISFKPSNNSPFNMDDEIVAESMVKQLRDLRKDDKVKAVVLRVNSPGGSAFASEIILQEVRRLKEKKPVVVSMGNVAASGGYYISCIANRIIAQPNTITGSIGVVGMFPTAEDLYKRIGARVETVSKGKWANYLRIDQDLSPEQTAVVMEYMQGIYDEFVDHVAAGRDQSRESIEASAAGRVWTGTQALQRKLVDELGGLDLAVERARELANISEKDSRVRLYPRQKDFFTFMIDRLDNTMLFLRDRLLFLPSDLDVQRVVDVLTDYLRHRDFVQAVLPIELP
jgi:protease-4